MNLEKKSESLHLIPFFKMSLFFQDVHDFILLRSFWPGWEGGGLFLSPHFSAPTHPTPRSGVGESRAEDTERMLRPFSHSKKRRIHVGVGGGEEEEEV